MRVDFLRLDAQLPMPRHAHDGDAGLDLYSRHAVLIPPNGGRAAVPTGIALAIDPGHVGLVVPRSGLATTHGVTVLNAPGVVDSGFRGEIVVLLVNHDPDTAHEILRGDRIAQLIVTVARSVELVQVDVLARSRRGPDGFGSTGR